MDPLTHIYLTLTPDLMHCQGSGRVYSRRNHASLGKLSSGPGVPIDFKNAEQWMWICAYQDGRSERVLTDEQLERMLNARTQPEEE